MQKGFFTLSRPPTWLRHCSLISASWWPHPTAFIELLPQLSPEQHKTQSHKQI